MEFGLFIFATDLGPAVADLARAADERGFHALFLPEHTHIPVSRKELAPGGAPLPDEHRRSLDPFVALAAAAAATERLKLGTGICLVAQRDPVILAKEVATLDHISNGRFVFGIGHGWHFDEVANHGIDPRHRRAIAAEKVAAMKAIWANDVASWDGPHVRFTPLHSWPKPVQSPHPPILLGGSPNSSILRDVVAYADGWMPYAWFHDVAAGVSRLEELASHAERDPTTIEIAVMGCPPRLADIDRYRRLGAARVIFDLPSEDWDVMRRRLDRYARLLEGAER